MAENKSKVEKISLFLERWEGRSKAKDRVTVCQRGNARCGDSDTCGRREDGLADEKHECVVARGLWSRYVRRFPGLRAESCPLLSFAFY